MLDCTESIRKADSPSPKPTSPSLQVLARQSKAVRAHAPVVLLVQIQPEILSLTPVCTLQAGAHNGPRGMDGISQRPSANASHELEKGAQSGGGQRRRGCRQTCQRIAEGRMGISDRSGCGRDSIVESAVVRHGTLKSWFLFPKPLWIHHAPVPSPESIPKRPASTQSHPPPHHVQEFSKQAQANDSDSEPKTLEVYTNRSRCNQIWFHHPDATAQWGCYT